MMFVTECVLYKYVLVNKIIFHESWLGVCMRVQQLYFSLRKWLILPISFRIISEYCQTSNISRTLVGNKAVDDSDVVVASPVGAAPTYIFILNLTPGFKGLGEDNCKTGWETFKSWDLVQLILEAWRYYRVLL